MYARTRKQHFPNIYMRVCGYVYRNCCLRVRSNPVGNIYGFLFGELYGAWEGRERRADPPLPSRDPILPSLQREGDGWIVKNPVVRAFQEEQAEQERKGEGEWSRVGKEKVRSGRGSIGMEDGGLEMVGCECCIGNGRWNLNNRTFLGWCGHAFDPR